MEVLVIEDEKEVEDFAVNDDGSTMIVKKRRRRVSFATTQTVHFIPRRDDLDTPPLLSTTQSTPPPIRPAEVSNSRAFSTPADMASNSAVVPNPNSSADFGQYTGDMDTGHEIWADEDTVPSCHSFDAMEDEEYSGCFVHLGHISRSEDEDSIVNDVLDGDITMDATTFSRNLSQFIKTTLDAQALELRGKSSSQQGTNDNDLQSRAENESDACSEGDSMALTTTGAPHWALVNPHDVSMPTDLDESDMSIATGTEQVSWKQREVLLAEHNRSDTVSGTGERVLTGEANICRPSKLLDDQKENLSLRKLQDGSTSKVQTWALDPPGNSDISMSLTNSTDISAFRALPKRSDVLVSIDGNVHTPPMSRRRSDSLLQDTTFTDSDFNTTVPVRNLNDLLLDQTDYTMTRTQMSTQKVVESHTSRAEDFKSLSHSKPNQANSQNSECLPSSMDLTGEKNEKASYHVTEQVRLVNDAPKQKLVHTSSSAVQEVRQSSTTKSKSPFKGGYGPRGHAQAALTASTEKRKPKASYQVADQVKLLMHAGSPAVAEVRKSSTTKPKSPFGGVQVPGSHAQAALAAHTVEKKEKASYQVADQVRLVSDAMKHKLIDTLSPAVKEVRKSSMTKSKSPFRGVEMPGRHAQGDSTASMDENTPKASYQVADPVRLVGDTTNHKLINVGSPAVKGARKSSVTKLKSPYGDLQVPESHAQAVPTTSIGHVNALRLVKDSHRKFNSPHPSILHDRGAPSTEGKKVAYSGSGRKLGTYPRQENQPYINCLLSLQDIIQSLEGKVHIKDDQAGGEDLVPQLQLKLQTLMDYLVFSCCLQPQMSWLMEHVDELRAKLSSAKHRNTQIRCSKIFLQKLTKESMHVVEAKFASTYSLAKKNWLEWKVHSERQKLEMLRERKETLMKELETIRGSGQQVLLIKDSYAEISSKEPCQRHDTHPTTTSKDRPFLQRNEMERSLEKWHNRYQDAYQQLNTSQAKSKEMGRQIQSIVSLYGRELQYGNVASLIQDMEASIQKLAFTNDLLKHQWVMTMSLWSRGEKSLIEFSLEGICMQRFEFEGHGAPARGKSSTTLHSEEIKKAFASMNAHLAFQYVSSDLRSISSVQIPHIRSVVQCMDLLFGTLMDVVFEIKHCGRNFIGFSGKFELQKDKLFLCVEILRSTHGLKVILMFDVSCLKGGNYPYDLKPADTRICTYGCKSSLTLDKVTACVTKVQSGPARLHRICRCVENLMATAQEVAQ